MAATLSRRLVDKEELRNYEGILDDRFQDNFRVRCAFCGKVGDIIWLVIQTFLNFHNIWANPPIDEPIFFKMVKTTNQSWADDSMRFISGWW